MRVSPLRAAIVFGFLALVPVALRGVAGVADEPTLTKEEIRQFLLTAEVVDSRRTSNGITLPSRLTLSDGTLTHDARFQSIDDHAPKRKLVNGREEIDFVDSYKYDLAAYALAELVGLDDMMPVTVERTWNRRTGALTWWLPVKMDEETRLKQGLQPPDPAAWNAQMYRMRVFTALVYDTDRNLTNILISDSWKIWMIDFTRAFRTYRELPNEKDLLRCDRALLARLRALDRDEVERATAPYLSRLGIDALMVRRDRIVERFDTLIAQQGERRVLY